MPRGKDKDGNHSRFSQPIQYSVRGYRELPSGVSKKYSTENCHNPYKFGLRHWLSTEYEICQNMSQIVKFHEKSFILPARLRHRPITCFV